VIPYERGFVLEYGLDHLGAIDYKKGCYIGQELTARMHYRDLGKRELVRFETPMDVTVGAALFKNDTEIGSIVQCVAQNATTGEPGAALALVETAALLMDGDVFCHVDGSAPVRIQQLVRHAV
jgi:hypothetical protein